MSSLWNRSGTIERYADDLRAAGAKAYFYIGDTVTPLTVYSDAAENSAHSHPVVADANGRWPDIFIPYITSYDVQVTTADDVQLTYTQMIPNPDPIDLSVTIPAENQVSTGMVHAELVNTTKAGYVRLNGRSIGNAASSGTERANADTEDLFTYLWNNLSDTIAPVSGGRGASAAADFAANKNIGLPDMRGAVPIGLDDMGNSAAGAFGSLSFATGDGVTPGSNIGDNEVTLVAGQIPSVATGGPSGTHTHNYLLPGALFVEVQSGLGTQVVSDLQNNAALTGNPNSDAHTHSTVAGSTPLNNLPVSVLVTWYIKL